MKTFPGLSITSSTVLYEVGVARQFRVRHEWEQNEIAYLESGILRGDISRMVLLISLLAERFITQAQRENLVYNVVRDIRVSGVDIEMAQLIKPPKNSSELRRGILGQIVRLFGRMGSHGLRRACGY